jgi:hypothetical protein
VERFLRFPFVVKSLAFSSISTVLFTFYSLLLRLASLHPISICKGAVRILSTCFQCLYPGLCLLPNHLALDMDQAFLLVDNVLRILGGLLIFTYPL